MSAAAAGGAAQAQAPASGEWTKFQLACMTLPWGQFPLDRALKGIAAAGFKYVAWGTTHQNTPGKREPVIAADATTADAKRLADRSRGMGLEPVMMFSEIYVDAPDSLKVHTRRIEQAAAAGIGFVLTFGAIRGGGRADWIRNLRTLGPIAREHKVLIVIKQHGGETGTGADCSRIIADVADDGVKMCYDAGNVLDYNSNDPIKDIATCWRDIRAFAIKDHRDTPKDQDCGPGFGEIDHYKLLMPVMRTGLTMPLAFENITAPLLPRPQNPEAFDALARRAREFVETVIGGLQAV